MKLDMASSDLIYEKWYQIQSWKGILNSKTIQFCDLLQENKKS